LAKRISGEFAVSEALAECLLYTTDDEVWVSLFVVMYGSEVHRFVIEEIIDLMGYDIENFREFALNGEHQKIRSTRRGRCEQVP
jgi:hypothetical protein